MLKFNDYLKEAALSAKQKKIAAVAGDKDKIDSADLAALRAGKKPVEEASCSSNMKKEELVGKQHKLDKNKNGKLDAHDFKLLRKEEAEHEASHMTSADHVYANSDSPGHEDRKAYKEHMKNHFNVTTKFYDSGDTVEHHGSHKDMAAAKKHINYLDKHGSVSGFSGHETHDVNESAEQIDELSKDTLNSYVKGAATDLPRYGNTLGRLQTHGKLKDVEKTLGRSITNRHRGIGRAVDKLTKEEVEINEGKMKDIYTDMMHHATKKGYSSHKEFTSADYDTVGKQHGISGKELAVIAGHKTAQQADTNFKKPVEPGKGMDRAKALAQRGMQSLSKEEVERIEEKLTQIDELSKKTMGSYTKKAVNDLGDKAHELGQNGEEPDYDDYDDTETQTGALRRGVDNRQKGITRAVNKITKEEVEQIDELSKKTLGSYLKKAERQHEKNYDKGYDLSMKYADVDDSHPMAKKIDKHIRLADKRGVGANLARSKINAKEEVSAEMSPYLKATLKVMDEGKIDNLRDAQKLRQDTQSAYDKNYKPDTSHPHIQVVKGNAYGGANQKDDEGDDKPDETKEKKGRGRPTGSKSGARQKGGGHEDGGIPVHNLNLPKSYK
jgi:hypothetical protein